MIRSWTIWIFFIFFFNDTATTEIYTLSLHDALPIWEAGRRDAAGDEAALDRGPPAIPGRVLPLRRPRLLPEAGPRSEEHTSELQSRQYLVCRLLLEKKKNNHPHPYTHYIRQSPTLDA